MSSETRIFAMDNLQEEFTEKIKDILVSNGIEDVVSEVANQYFVLTDEGLTSQTTCVTVKFSDPSIRSINLFIKTETVNESQKEYLEEAKYFEKESLFFSKYVPALAEFLKAKCQEQLLGIYPKCYHADRKMIVLENIVLDRGFELLDKVEKQDFEAASMALRTLAKHHAISFAYMKEIGGVRKLTEAFPNIDFEPFAKCQKLFEATVEGAIQTGIQNLMNSLVEGREGAIAALKEKQGRAWNHVLESLKSDPNDRLLLLNHGDYWNNNMLFKRNKETGGLLGLVDHVVVDFQVIRIDSPGADLGYFLFTSVKPEVRRSRLKDLLKVYLNVVNDTSSALGHPIELTFNELFENLRKRFEFGFWLFGVLAATKASYCVMKERDKTRVDVCDWARTYQTLIQKWIEKNPEQCELDAREMVKLMQEYKQLSLNT